jgi:hypothetical protein
VIVLLYIFVLHFQLISSSQNVKATIFFEKAKSMKVGRNTEILIFEFFTREVDFLSQSVVNSNLPVSPEMYKWRKLSWQGLKGCRFTISLKGGSVQKISTGDDEANRN